MRAIRRVMLGAVAATVASATLGAQAFSPTGKNASGGLDQSWTVACSALGPVGQPACPASGQATVVTAAPAGWLTTPTGDGARYISSTASASIWPDAPNEDPHYQYAFSSTFDVASNVTAIGFSTFRFDNYWVSGTLNGHDLTINPMPVGPDGNNWQSLFNLTSADGLNAGGTNTLTLTITGNGRTDGILVDDYHVTATPEPSSVALLGTGLIGLVPMVRRRRK